MIRGCRRRIWGNNPDRNKTNGPEPLARSGPFGFQEGKQRGVTSTA